MMDSPSSNRLHRINELGARHALERSRRFLGRVQEVLVEGRSSKDDSLVFGRNPHNRLVYFKGDIAELKGKLVDVIITDAKAFSLIGRLQN